MISRTPIPYASVVFWGPTQRVLGYSIGARKFELLDEGSCWLWGGQEQGEYLQGAGGLLL